MTKSPRSPARLHHEPEALAWAREKAGLSQAELARRCGWSRSTICEYEAGTRSATPGNLLKIAEALNCPVVFLERKREVAS